jgi:hypothetical protein
MGRRNNNPFGFQGQGMAPAWSQQTNLGRYRPPTMSDFGGYNSNMWNDQGGMDYNLPGSYGSPLGQGQFAPMPRQFQQYLMGGGFGGMGRDMDRMRQQQIMSFGAGASANDYYNGMANDFYGSQQPRYGGGGSYEDYRNNWQGSNRFADGRTGTMQVISGEDIPLSEEEWRASQGGGAPAGKDGRPLPDPNQAGSVGTDPLSFLRNQTMINNGMAPSFNQRRRGFNRNAETAPQPMEPMPAYDRPENMNYNMAALRQMMGGG